MREVLLPAKERAGRGELTILKPWLTPRASQVLSFGARHRKRVEAGDDLTNASVSLAPPRVPDAVSERQAPIVCIRPPRRSGPAPPGGPPFSDKAHGILRFEFGRPCPQARRFGVRRLPSNSRGFEEALEGDVARPQPRSTSRIPSGGFGRSGRPRDRGPRHPKMEVGNMAL